MHTKASSQLMFRGVATKRIIKTGGAASRGGEGVPVQGEKREERQARRVKVEEKSR